MRLQRTHAGPTISSPDPSSSPLSPSLAVMTYNIHGGVNIYGRRDPAAIARIIARLNPDVVALQEVDTMGPRMRHLNHAQWLAERLGMHYHFRPLRNSRWGEFGSAVLSRYPMSLVKTSVFPGRSANQIREPRGALWVCLHTPRGNIHVINTHLSLRLQDRLYQVRQLLGREWLGGIAGQPAVLCGDFNAGVRSLEYRVLCSRLSDAQVQARQKGYPRPTFISIYPFFRLDHIFTSSHFGSSHVLVPAGMDARKASDHLPLWARLSFRGVQVGHS